MNPNMLKVIEFVKDECERLTPLDDILDKTGYNRTHVSVLFKSIYGVTPKQYRDRHQANLIREEVLKDRLSGEQIMAKFDIVNRQHLSYTMNKHFGKTVTQIRKEGVGMKDLLNHPRYLAKVNRHMTDEETLGLIDKCFSEFPERIYDVREIFKLTGKTDAKVNQLVRTKYPHGLRMTYRRLRLSYVMRDLKETTDDLDDIAYRYGFDDLECLCKLIQRLYNYDTVTLNKLVRSRKRRVKFYDSCFRSNDRFIHSVVEDINVNFRHYATRDCIANKFGKNPDNLSVMFRKRTGKTLKAYLDSLKLERLQQLVSHRCVDAEKLIRETGYPTRRIINYKLVECYGLTLMEIKKAFERGESWSTISQSTVNSTPTKKEPELTI